MIFKRNKIKFNLREEKKNISRRKIRECEMCCLIKKNDFHVCYEIFFNYCKRKTTINIYVLFAGKHTNATAFFHATQILFSFTHIRINLVHTLLNTIQLLCDIVRNNSPFEVNVTSNSIKASENPREGKTQEKLKR